MEKLSNWNQTRKGQVVAALVEAGLAYGFGSLAIDRGHLLLYGLTLFSAGACLVTIVNIFKSHD